jgi:glycosyl transferase family 87
MRQRFLRAFDEVRRLDFTQTMPFVVLAVVFFAVRLPYVNYGHGTDPDAWRVALTAHYLLDTGDYFPSRLPGNPLHELAMTLFIPGGWIATNIATAVASLAGVWIFARIVRELDVPNRGLLVIGFAFAPLLVINSIATMDYMWALTFILGAYYSVNTGRPLLAGICVGLAAGFRLQSAMFALPLLYLLWREQRKDELAPFALAAGGTALLAFSPVLVVYGTSFLNYYDASVGYQDVLRLLGKEALGILGVLGVLAGAALSLSNLRRLPQEARLDPHLGVWLVTIVLYFASFSRLPHEIAYLIPVFPFGLLLMGRYFTRAGLGVAVAAILLAGVVDVTTPGAGITPDTLRTATIGKGLVLSNGDTMSGQQRFVERIVENPIPRHSVILTGFIYPQLVVREYDHLEARVLRYDYDAISMLSDRGEAVDTERDIRFVWLLGYETFETLRTQGYAFFFVPDAGGATYALYEYRPALLGAMLLNIDIGPSVSEGQAGTDR